jgi:UDP-N-acetylmuramoyl-tripeptide--D-alanyl-D-alanine ligase
MVPLTNGARVLFDAYNANPDSMTVLLKNIYEMDVQGRKFFVAGDMKELGSYSEDAHEEIGERAGATGFEGIWYVGEFADAFARGLQKSHKPKIFLSTASADPQTAKEFAKNFAPGDLVAVKGSRGMHLETAVESWPLGAPLGKKP